MISQPCGVSYGLPRIQFSGSTILLARKGNHDLVYVRGVPQDPHARTAQFYLRTQRIPKKGSGAQLQVQDNRWDITSSVVLGVGLWFVPVPRSGAGSVVAGHEHR